MHPCVGGAQMKGNSHQSGLCSCLAFYSIHQSFRFLIRIRPYSIHPTCDLTLFSPTRDSYDGPFWERCHGRVWQLRVPLPRIGPCLRVSWSSWSAHVGPSIKFAISCNTQWFIYTSINILTRPFQNGCTEALDTHSAFCCFGTRICKPWQLLGCLQCP
jgi:hypothetical protein